MRIANIFFFNGVICLAFTSNTSLAFLSYKCHIFTKARNDTPSQQMFLFSLHRIQILPVCTIVIIFIRDAINQILKK